MRKLVIICAATIGFLFLLVAFFVGSSLFSFLGFLSIGGGIFYYYGLGKILTKDQVLQTWASLIENANGRGDEIIKTTEEFIIDRKSVV